MSDIVERLDRLATWGGNATHLNYEVAILDAKAEIERLRDENARLRAALVKISNSVHGSFDDAHVMADIARAALEAKDDC